MRTLNTGNDGAEYTDPNIRDIQLQQQDEDICMCVECQEERNAILAETYGEFVDWDDYEEFLADAGLDDGHPYATGTSYIEEEGPDGREYMIVRYDDETEENRYPYSYSDDRNPYYNDSGWENHSGWVTGDPDIGSSSSWMDGQSGQEGSDSFWQDSSSYQNPDDGYDDNGSFTDDSHAWS